MAYEIFDAEDVEVCDLVKKAMESDYVANVAARNAGAHGVCAQCVYVPSRWAFGGEFIQRQ